MRFSLNSVMGHADGNLGDFANTSYDPFYDSSQLILQLRVITGFPRRNINLYEAGLKYTPLQLLLILL